MSMPEDVRSVPPARRPYRQAARARSSAATRERVLAAACALVEQDAARPASLEAVAARAGTTVPTVLRHFGTSEALLAAALGAALAGLRTARPRVRPGDHAGAARVLGGEYETHHALLRAADALPPTARRELEPARRLHRDWLARTFALTLSPLAPVVHRRRLAQLVAVSGPATWRALRETERLSPGQAQAALAELLRALSR